MKITINDVAYGGLGIGKIDGKVCFVDYAVPGDILNVEIYKNTKSYSFAKIIEIISPSSQRIKPDCPVFGICGGCSHLNISYDYEIEQKTTVLKNLLHHISGIENGQTPKIEIKTANRFGYRSHSVLKKNKNILGFFQKKTNQIVPLPQEGCRILSDSINRGIITLNRNSFSKEVKVIKNYKDEFIATPTDSNFTVLEKAGGIYYNRSSNGFFQANMYLRESMLDIVKNYSSLNEKDEFIDIGCGCGFFTLHLAKYCDKGYGFDIDRTSIKYAIINAQNNHIDNVQFRNLSVDNILPHRISPKAIIVDPPRAGISTKGRKTIQAINAEIIVYVSCNPATYARDIKDFLKNNYKLDKITMIDMFPGTHHIEIICKLIKI